MPILNPLFQTICKTAPLFFILFCLFPSIYGGQEKLKELKKAERLFYEKLYGDALPLYKATLFSNLNEVENFKTELFFRLAACHLQQNNPQDALHDLISLELEKLNPPHHLYLLYLMSLAHRQLGNHQSALSFINQCVTSSQNKYLLNLFALEKGSCLFQLGHLNKAAEEFESIQPDHNEPSIFYLAQLYLVKIHLRDHNISSAHQILDELASFLPFNHPLNIEKYYLEGFLFLLENQEKNAVECFEKVLLKTPTFNSIQSVSLIKLMVGCCLKLLLNQNLSLVERHILLTKGNILLEKLFEIECDNPPLQEKKQSIIAEWSEQIAKSKALIHIQSEEWDRADTVLNQWIFDHPHALNESEAWFWKGYCAEQKEAHPLKIEYYQKAYSLNPTGPFAAAAYFRIYSYLDYLHGRKKSIKHLQAMPSLFPNHPLLISAYYLIGLYHKKDHLSEEGKIIRAKDLTGACDAFERAASICTLLMENHSIPVNEVPYFLQVRYHSQLEKGKSYFAIAQSSKGGKRQIYLKYAEEVFAKLCAEFEHTDAPFSTDRNSLSTTIQAVGNLPFLSNLETYPKVFSEAEFRRVQVLKESGKVDEREAILNGMLIHFQQAGITQGYWLTKTLYEKGELAYQAGKPLAALNYFLEAEKSCVEKTTLSPDEKLDLYIQQSLCYKELDKLEDAMRLLSQVINEDVISSIRIKAMFLRAEVYESQGRPELALKQLEAASRKGGEWAEKAQKKMESNYGY